MAYTTCNDNNSAENYRQPVNLANSPSRWRCCNCKLGWFNVATDADCPGCFVRRCGGCTYAAS
ncbi:hypothetical protein BHE90_017333 [Fusarium euwallaceae]|uniref:Uncharacterized protein n=3 Tax=Fusarium solani species complex TaxID=232080 RepID=A0A428SAF6_9HYPO|nr:hypothetical protein CEP51_016599 [Fusarium floridanum]RSL86762.1 hypothetical protein CEP52_015724 [Fusarium oligoseptatum]RTE68290.1 hypothetical protein BHE90_017333 [Fusarium euwallaceae]